MTITTILANALRPGDILEPDGTQVLKITQGIQYITVKIKPPKGRRETWDLPHNWQLRVRKEP